MTKHFLALTALTFTFVPFATAQKWFTRDGKVYFNATAPNSPEKIEAYSLSGTCVLDQPTGAVEMSVLVQGFTFERALMKDHFNENYMESNKYPKAVFKGKIENPAAVNWTTDGTYNTNVVGTLTIHDVAKDLTTPLKVTVQDGKPAAEVHFSVILKDYNISIPGLVADKVNKTVKIDIAAPLEPLKR
jgi:polyisoprenoid-binding protein YceI